MSVWVRKGLSLRRPNNPQQRVRQQTYLRALRTIPHLTIHLGSYLEKPTRMPLHPPPAAGPKTVQVMKSEEKGSDVNLACYLLVDAFDADYEAAVVVSNDSDLAEPIRLVRQKFGKKVLSCIHAVRGGHSALNCEGGIEIPDRGRLAAANVSVPGDAHGCPRDDP